MNLRKRKWLVIGIYKPSQSCSKMFIEKLSNQLNDLHTNYDILLLGDFNMTPEDLKLQVFCDTHDLENLIKEPICFKEIERFNFIEITKVLTMICLKLT